MDWSNDEVMQLIEAYRDRPILWDPTHTLYKSQNKKSIAWGELGKLFQIKPVVVKCKVNSLLASFRRERQKEALHLKSGAGMNRAFKSNWFAFKSMSFLMDKYKSRNSQDNDDHIILDYGRADDEESKEEKNSFPPYYNFHLENDESSTAMQQLRAEEFPSPKHEDCAPKRKKSPRVEEDYTILKKRRRDANTVFGEHVAHKLSAYSSHTTNVVQYLINNVLFEADMGKYDVKSAPQSDTFSWSPSLSSRPSPIPSPSLPFRLKYSPVYSPSPQSPVAQTEPHQGYMLVNEETQPTVQTSCTNNIASPEAKPLIASAMT